MNRSIRFAILGRALIGVACGVAGGAACGGTFDGDATTPVGHRLITGRLVPPTQSELTRQPVALQLAAASIDARLDPPIVSFSASVPFSPSSNAGQPVRFRLSVPSDQSFILLFQVPVDGREGLGQMVSRVRFARSSAGDLTDLVSGRSADLGVPARDLDLGVVKIEGSAASNGTSGASPLAGNVVLLGEGDAINPLGLNDTDGDGTPDIDDADDDNDLVPDEVDDDANGDQIPDASQVFDALSHLDTDLDQIPDIFQP